MGTESRQKWVLSTGSANCDGLARAQFVPVCGQREASAASRNILHFPRHIFLPKH
jgi:hypothetical protein